MVAHAQAGHWDELAALAKNKKNPIGFEVCGKLAKMFYLDLHQVITPNLSM